MAAFVDSIKARCIDLANRINQRIAFVTTYGFLDGTGDKMSKSADTLNTCIQVLAALDLCPSSDELREGHNTYDARSELAKWCQRYAASFGKASLCFDDMTMPERRAFVTQLRIVVYEVFLAISAHGVGIDFPELMPLCQALDASVRG